MRCNIAHTGDSASVPHLGLSGMEGYARVDLQPSGGAIRGMHPPFQVCRRCTIRPKTRTISHHLATRLRRQRALGVDPNKKQRHERVSLLAAFALWD